MENDIDRARHQQVADILRQLASEGSLTTDRLRQHIAKIAGPHAWALYVDLVECGHRPDIPNSLQPVGRGAGPEHIEFWRDLAAVNSFLLWLNVEFPPEFGGVNTADTPQ